MNHPLFRNRKVSELELELQRRTALPGHDPLLENNKKLIAMKEQLLNENKDLTTKLKVFITLDF